MEKSCESWPSFMLNGCWSWSSLTRAVAELSSQWLHVPAVLRRRWNTSVWGRCPHRHKERGTHGWTLNVTVFVAADAVWHAGDRFGRLAEEHHLQTLHQEQQADPLVLAGMDTLDHWARTRHEPWTTHTHIYTRAVKCMCRCDWWTRVPTGGERDGQREENPPASVCNGNLSAACGRLQRAHRCWSTRGLVNDCVFVEIPCFWGWRKKKNFN